MGASYRIVALVRSVEAIWAAPQIRHLQKENPTRLGGACRTDVESRVTTRAPSCPTGWSLTPNPPQHNDPTGCDQQR